LLAQLKVIRLIAAIIYMVLYQTSSRPATVTLFDNNNVINYTTTAADGSYTLSAPAGGGYKLVVTKPGYLSYTLKELTLIAEADIEIVDIRLLAGDINGDGIVNATDLTYLLAEFGGAPLIFPYADIDGDGIVNAIDLTYLLAGFNNSNVEKIADPVGKPSLPRQITINAVTGRQYDIPLAASGITSFSGMQVNFKYDSAVFDLIDLCAFTGNKILMSGPIAAAGIIITQVNPGEIRFTVNKTIPAGMQWSGPLTTIRLKAKTTAASIVNVE
jgi:hypothetical protein